ncbi:MAG: hypothetical protein II922_07355 [Succinimonas sp.]|nr:hypothetical protein [Succinimonas sp.]
MGLSIRTSEEIHDYLERERQDAAEQGRKEGEKIGEARGVKIGEEKTVVYFYKKGLIPKNVAIAKLGVTDQDFETLLQRYS